MMIAPCILQTFAILLLHFHLVSCAAVRSKLDLVKGVGPVYSHVYKVDDHDAPSLVFIHSNGHDSQIWKNACSSRKDVETRRPKSKYCNILEQMALAGFSVYAMDLPGHGRSDASSQTQAALKKNFIDRYLAHNSITKPIFVTAGHAYSFINRRLKVDPTLATVDEHTRTLVNVAGWIGIDVPKDAIAKLEAVETTIHCPILLVQPSDDDPLSNATVENLQDTMLNVQISSVPKKHFWQHRPKAFVLTALDWLHSNFPVHDGSEL